MTKHIRFLNLTLLLGALLVGLAFAEGTSANERITNVATATYNDSAGDPQTTTSNPVTTIVQPVYSFTILPDGADENTPGQTETALPGGPVYFNYTVTNTGNTVDTIDLTAFDEAATDNGGTPFDDDGATAGDGSDFDLSGVTVYLDTGCDGSIAGDSVATSVTLDADESTCIIVAATIPNTATDGQVANVNVYGASQGDATVTEENNWARAEANTAGNLTANKVASPASGTPIAAGGLISYTVSGSNNGGGAAFGQAVSYIPTGGGAAVATTGIVISDVLDANVVYTAATLTGTAGAGTVIPVYSDDGGTTWYEAEANVVGTIDAVGMIIEGTGAFFTQSANYSMSFDVTVAAAAAEGTPITNQATVAYSTDGIDTPSTTTNTTNNPVAGAYDVRIGPEGLPNANAATLTGASPTSYTDPASGKTWNVTLSGDGTLDPSTDTQTITNTVLTGETVAFKHTIQNTGNATDSFDISAASASGYTVTLFQANGTTPLLGSVGPLDPGDTLDIVVKVAVSLVLRVPRLRSRRPLIQTAARATFRPTLFLFLKTARST